MSALTDIESLITTLGASGVPASQVTAAVGSLFGGVANKAKAILGEIANNVGNPAVVADEVKDLLELSNWSAAVAADINALPPAAAAAAANPAQNAGNFNGLVSAISAAIAAA